MKKTQNLRKLSSTYNRWKKQLIALHKGHIAIVKKLAVEAKEETRIKSDSQLSFSFTH